ncbi:MAG: hypothetical protein NTU49_00710 [Gammaproteobacteria bacterium]|nr:hypothetical protein [Gammaproteobacteria bacterium]
MEKNKIAEYYLIDKQGSFLCIDEHGNHSYLAVHSQKSIKDWVTIYGNDCNLQPDALVEINEYKKIPFFYPAKEPHDFDKTEWSKHLYLPQVLEGREKYFIAKIIAK